MFQLVFAVCTDRIQIKIVERLTECIPLIQDAFLGQSGLKAFQNQHLEQLVIVMKRNTPFFVMVTYVPFIFRICPAAAIFSVGPLHMNHILSAGERVS